MLAGKTDVGQVLCGGGASHRHAQVVPVLVLERMVSVEDLLPQVVWQWSPIDNRPCLFAAVCQVSHVVRINTFQGFVQGTPGIGLIENITIGIGSDGKAIGHFYPLRSEFAIHLPQGRCLASY